jgi:hypothetical protein
MPATFLPDAIYGFNPDGRSFMNGHLYPEFTRKVDQQRDRSHAQGQPVLKILLESFGVDGSASVGEQADAIISIAFLAAINEAAA